uniref:hypothetical protein n=1 Tax=Amycolatopsis sp. CA-096443 TaxID=3239919 RepID=UPI003F49685F
MTIGELVALLRATAGELPDGFDAEVRVSMCDGENIETTRAIVADVATEVDPGAGRAVQYAIVQGHPHEDDQSYRARGIAHGTDDALRQWAEDDRN